MLDQLRAQRGVNMAIELAAEEVMRQEREISWSVIFNGGVIRGMIHVDGAVTVSGDQEVMQGITVRVVRWATRET